MAVSDLFVTERGAKCFRPSPIRGVWDSGSPSPTLYPPRGELLLIYAFLSHFQRAKPRLARIKPSLDLGKDFFLDYVSSVSWLVFLCTSVDKEHEPRDVIYTQQYFYTKKCK